MDLKTVVKRLQKFGDEKLACNWDNVGLLVEPSEPLIVKKILVTNDLTEPVLDEALKLNANLIISYHPAIFTPLKRLTQSEWKQRSIVKCIENKIAVYSPHTSWDVIQGGNNDWILSAFETKKIEPIESIKNSSTINNFSKSIKVNLSFGTSKDKLLAKASGLDDVKFISEKQIAVIDMIKQAEVEFLTTTKGVNTLIDLLNATYDSSVLGSLRIYDLDKPLLKDIGVGRIGYLNEPKKLSEIVEILKTHFKMKTFRLALANGKKLDDLVNKIGVCAGSGGKVLNNLDCDLIVTGEFGHHEILHEVHRGTSVILTDHTNTERGYLNEFKKKFTDLLKENNDESIEIFISKVDRDPLEYI